MSLKVGIVGAGRMGRSHLARLEQMANIEVVAICDIKRETAKNVARRVRARVFSDYKEMYEKEKLDAVFICTPAYSREKQLELAAQQGIHVFVEKPVARTIEQGESTCEAIEKSGIICSAGFLWRYSQGVRKIREVLKDKKLALIDACWYHTIPPIAWVRSRKMGGGQVVDQSIHLIDLMRYWTGEVKEAYGHGTRGLFREIDDFTADDASGVTLVFASGTVANLSSTYSLFSGPNLGPRMNLIARSMYIELVSENVRIYRPSEEEVVFDEQAHLAHMARNPEVNIEQCDTGLTEAAIMEDKVFLDAIEHSDPSKIMSSFQDGLKTLKVALAVNRSIETGEVVIF